MTMADDAASTFHESRMAMATIQALRDCGVVGIPGVRRRHNDSRSRNSSLQAASKLRAAMYHGSTTLYI